MSKECDFCNKRKPLFPKNSKSKIYISGLDCNNKVFLYIYNEVEENGDYNSIWAKEICYCPICGRKLNIESSDKE